MVIDLVYLSDDFLLTVASFSIAFSIFYSFYFISSWINAAGGKMCLSSSFSSV